MPFSANLRDVTTMSEDSEKLAFLMRQLASLVGEFERLTPGRKFTPDGHLVGSIEELIGATEQGLTLTPAPAKRFSAPGACPTEAPGASRSRPPSASPWRYDA